jgi:hypothetical protein
MVEVYGRSIPVQEEVLIPFIEKLAFGYGN